nr:replication factor c subunit 1 [Quercus suber]
MPSDIRNFFGGKPTGTPAAKPKEEPKKRGRKKVISDDEEEVVKPSPKRAVKKKQPEPEPVGEETTADDYFGKGTKPKRSEVVRRKAAARESTPQPNGKSAEPRGSVKTPRSRGKKDVSYVEVDENDFPDDDVAGDTDNFKADAMVGKRMGDDYQEGTDDDDGDDKSAVPIKKTNGRQTKSKADDDFDPDGDVDMKDTNADDDFLDPDADEQIVENKPAKRGSAKTGKKRKVDDEDDLEIDEVKPKKRATHVKKAAATPKKAKKEEVQDSEAMKEIFDSIPTIVAPEPPAKTSDEKPKFVYGQHGNSAIPAAALDSSELPQGEENCLAGLTFVFTGQLQHLGREQGQAMVKQYGGKITTAPSKKTSYVVLGEDAGPKKLETIKQHGLKVINEEGLFELIKRLPANGGDSAAAAQQAERRAKEDEKIREAAMEMEREEKAQKAAAAKAATAKGMSSSTGTSSTPSKTKGKESLDGPDNRLWTVRYAPTQLTQICGNKTQVEKLQRWLRMFPKNQRTGFKMGGNDGSGLYRAVMIHGPPGIGKTTAAHLVAKLEGYDVVESNASDTRSKKLVETGLKGVLSTTSLMGYFAAGGEKTDASKKKLVLIMDEVDGMSAGDRGGVGALAAVCKKTQIPMILICNERKQPKMKPFDFVTFDLGFRRPTTDMIRSRISTIAFREGLKMPPNVINALIEGTGADIRQVVNMISTAKLDAQNMSFEESKDMSKAWEKHIVLKPWAMVETILGKGLFNAASKSTLNDKQEIYFNDHEFGPLMMQENYLGTKPQRANKYDGNAKLQNLSRLDLVSKAADSISDGDLVDRMIHGSQQQWSLMPTHAIFSFVRPASFMYGTLAGHQTRFTTWLGNNSKYGKLMRFVKDIQGHMRLRVSADRYEVRQTYLPLLFEKLIRRLEKEGKDAVPEVIELMDSYFLTKDDWDAILELGVGDSDAERIKIETQAKASFTRIYNQQAHPLPFIKSSQVVAPKRAPPKEQPDLEEALEESGDEAVDDADVKEESDAEADLAKDKYVAKPKKRKAAATAGAAKKKGKAAADSEDEFAMGLVCIHCLTAMGFDSLNGQRGLLTLVQDAGLTGASGELTNPEMFRRLCYLMSTVSVITY